MRKTGTCLRNRRNCGSERVREKAKLGERERAEMGKKIRVGRAAGMLVSCGLLRKSLREAIASPAGDNYFSSQVSQMHWGLKIIFFLKKKSNSTLDVNFT